MGRNVLLANIDVGIFYNLVLVITKQRSPVSLPAIVIFCRIAIIYGKNKSSKQLFANIPYPLFDLKIHLCPVSHLHTKGCIDRELFKIAQDPASTWLQDFDQFIIFIDRNANLVKSVSHFDESDWKRIQEFV